MGFVMPKPRSAVNYWPDSKCARAFWGQQELPPYQQLLADTTAWLEPQPGERWLDLGCGCGKLSEALWRQSGGTLAEVVGLDCAAINAKAFEKLRQTQQPPIPESRLRFVAADFSRGLAAWPSACFDGVVSGLAIQYAESFCERTQVWTTTAYDAVLAEVFRLLRPGGRFIFSVNVPHPSWAWVALCSICGAFRARSLFRYIKKATRMWRYGGWLQREARRGRFHYLPLQTVTDKLTAAGFTNLEHRLSFARQAYLIRCRKPAVAQVAA